MSRFELFLTVALAGALAVSVPARAATPAELVASCTETSAFGFKLGAGAPWQTIRNGQYVVSPAYQPFEAARLSYTPLSNRLTSVLVETYYPGQDKAQGQRDGAEILRLLRADSRFTKSTQDVNGGWNFSGDGPLLIRVDYGRSFLSMLCANRDVMTIGRAEQEQMRQADQAVDVTAFE